MWKKRYFLIEGTAQKLRKSENIKKADEIIFRALYKGYISAIPRFYVEMRKKESIVLM